jgi:hypothetical protein
MEVEVEAFPFLSFFFFFPLFSGFEQLSEQFLSKIKNKVL